MFDFYVSKIMRTFFVLWLIFMFSNARFLYVVFYCYVSDARFVGFVFDGYIR